MKNLKKVLALVTMFTMLLSVAVSAGALYPDVDDNASYAEAVETLNALGIMIGDDQGNFNPEKGITRAETAAIIARIRALGEAASAAGGTIFADVPADHWAAGYVNLAQQSGIINGYGDGNFGPEDAVKYEQVIKMIVAALGRTPEAEKKGGYPSGYMIIAAQENITKGVSVKAGEDAPRSAVARLVFNALEVDVMEQENYTTGDEEYKVIKDKTLLKDYLKVNKVEGIVEGSYLTAATIDTEDDKIAIDVTKINGYASGDNFDADLAADIAAGVAEGKTNAAALVGCAVAAYVAENEETNELELLAIAKRSGRNEIIEIAADQIEDYTDGVLVYYEDDKEIEIELDITLEFFNNGYDRGEVAAFLGGGYATSNGVLTLIDNGTDNDDQFDVALLKEATGDAVVKKVDAEGKRLEGYAGPIDIDVEDEDVITKFYKADGAAAAFEDIAVDNTLTFYNNGNIVVVYISDVVVEGYVKEVIDNEYVIGENAYEPAAGVTVLPTDEGKFFINVEGEIAYKIANAASGTYAYLLEAALYKVGTKDKLELTYLTEDGVWESTNLADNTTVYNAGVKKYAKFDRADANIESGAFTGFLTAEFAANNPASGALIFQFTKNSDGLINKLYIGDAGVDNEIYLSKDDTASERAFDEDDFRISNIYMNAETKVFNVAETVATKKDITVVKAGSLFVDTNEYTVNAYDRDQYDVPAIMVAMNAQADIVAGTKLLVVDRIAETQDEEGETIYKIYGYQNGEEVYGVTVPDTEIEITGAEAVVAGDVIIFSLDVEGAIDKIEVVSAVADARAIIAGEDAAYYEADGLVKEAFGFVYKLENGRVSLAEDFDLNPTPLADADDTNAVFRLGEGVNVYEVNVTRANPSVNVLSAAKIKVATNYEKEAHWAYVRVYDGKIVDVVVYKTVTPDRPADIEA